MTTEAGPRRVGRPRVREETPRLGSYVGFRLPDELKEKLDGSAGTSTRSLSAETAYRVGVTFRDEDALAQAMALSYGEDNAGLTFLFAELVRRVAPYGGQWLDDLAVGAEVAGAVAHTLKRLRAPDDGHYVEGDSIEARVDGLLHEFAYDDDGSYGTSGARSPRARWMLEKRKRMGAEIAERLVRRRRAVREALEAMPPREMPKPDPASAAIWERAVAKINARVETPEAETPDSTEEPK